MGSIAGGVLLRRSLGVPVAFLSRGKKSPLFAREQCGHSIVCRGSRGAQAGKLDANVAQCRFEVCFQRLQMFRGGVGLLAKTDLFAKGVKADGLGIVVADGFHERACALCGSGLILCGKHVAALLELAQCRSTVAREVEQAHERAVDTFMCGFLA